jgi:hypothetical protein
MAQFNRTVGPMIRAGSLLPHDGQFATKITKNKA